MPSEVNPSLHYYLLKLIEENPEISQRQLASELGLSLGKANYCLRALIGKGLVKAENFRNNKNKLAYAYLLTPEGIEEKARITIQFFRRVETEYETLKLEVEQLEKKSDAAADSPMRAN